ncbi:MAG: hypothetical protein KGL48_04790 [Sphingomonadales bacterium]|nr:hypothetical protein [Sphingomonadales bacterium]MDE2568762.1 hypothetical protein [Sphingomonadales bacterium]
MSAFDTNACRNDRTGLEQRPTIELARQRPGSSVDLYVPTRATRRLSHSSEFSASGMNWQRVVRKQGASKARIVSSKLTRSVHRAPFHASTAMVACAMRAVQLCRSELIRDFPARHASRTIRSYQGSKWRRTIRIPIQPASSANCRDTIAKMCRFSLPPGYTRTRAQARADVFDYIECSYNPTWRHTTLVYLSPIDFESEAEVACKSLSRCPPNRQQPNQRIVLPVGRRERDGPAALGVQQQDVARHAMLEIDFPSMIHRENDHEFILYFRHRRVWTQTHEARHLGKIGCEHAAPFLAPALPGLDCLPCTDG